jgi:hypothetical protein
MKFRQICGLITALSILSVNSAYSGPILKPRKYHGPIPRSTLSLRIGFHGGASNEEMWDALDASVKPAGQAFTGDFGNAFILDGTYTYKLHPQFAVRANSSLTLFKSDSNGFLVPSIPNLPDSILQPVYDFDREFNVELIMIEASAIYYFADAGVNEFQTYFGGGFSAGIPRATYSESRTDQDTDEVIRDTEQTEWSLEAGIHGLLGALYFVKNNLAFNVEGRYQIVQSKYPFILDTTSGPQEVRFDVDYTGFIMCIGMVWAF